MKLNKKKIVAVALIISVVAILSLGSLAWFTAQDSVTNNFYVTDSETPTDGIFGVDVWEKDVNGNVISKDPNNDEGLVYEEILAGDLLTKEPYVENTGIHPMFVRATVTIEDAVVFEDVMGDDMLDPANLLIDINDAWTFDSTNFLYEDGKGTLTYTFYYNAELAPDQYSAPIFNDVLIPTALTTEQAEELGSFTMTVLAEAIQSENLGVSNAKEAFDLYW